MHGISASMAEIQFSKNKSIYPVTSFVYSLSQSHKFKAIQFSNVTLPLHKSIIMSLKSPQLILYPFSSVIQVGLSLVSSIFRNMVSFNHAVYKCTRKTIFICATSKFFKELIWIYMHLVVFPSMSNL